MTSPVKEKTGPSDNSNDGEWWPGEMDLNVVTIGNMSVDSKLVATDGERGRYREITVDSGTRESVVNPNDWVECRLETDTSALEVKRWTIWE